MFVEKNHLFIKKNTSLFSLLLSPFFIMMMYVKDRVMCHDSCCGNTAYSMKIGHRQDFMIVNLTEFPEPMNYGWPHCPRNVSTFAVPESQTILYSELVGVVFFLFHSRATDSKFVSIRVFRLDL